MEADSVKALDKAWIEGHISIQDDPAGTLQAALRSPSSLKPRTTQAETLESVAESVADSILEELQSTEVQALGIHFAAGNQTVPPEYDRKLIAMTANRLSRRLESTELRRVRGVFVSQVRKRLTE